MTAPHGDNALLEVIGLLAESSSAWAREGLIIVGGACLVAMVCFATVISLRHRILKRDKRRRRRRGRREKRRSAHTQSATAASARRGETPQPREARRTHHGGKSSHRHGRRRRRRRPQNPTLAETGGLPPKRPDKRAGTGSDV